LLCGGGPKPFKTTIYTDGGTIRIALVDDHRLFRSGIASLLENFDRYKIIFEAGDGEEMIRKINPKIKPHIILLDINMPA